MGTNKKIKIDTIKVYPSNIEVWDVYGGFYNISTDGCRHEYTRAEWEEDLIDRYNFDDESVEKLLNAMETYDIINDDETIKKRKNEE